MATSRRQFLRATFAAPALVSLGSAAPALLVRSALAAARDRRGTILVVVQLSGGNDGLNTLVPYRDDHYRRSRPTLALPARRLHKINASVGFHPRMGDLARLFEQGYLGVVQGVGYPHPSSDHGVSMRVWQTAATEPRQTGWLGRAADLAGDANSADAAAVLAAGIAPPRALGATAAIVPRVQSIEQATLQNVAGAAGQSYRRLLARAAALPRTGRSGHDNRLLEFVRQTTLTAYGDSRRLTAVAQAHPQAGSYGDFPLANALETVAQLIRADLGIRIFYTELGGDGFGGFDNHANQLGNHGALLQQLSAAVAALVRDLQHARLLDRVVLMTFSEFGRTVAENGRRGTGHGSAAPMFLAGGKVRAGLVGRHPSLTELENGGLKHHTDFRRVYAAVLDRWLGLDSQAILGRKFEPLDVLRG